MKINKTIFFAFFLVVINVSFIFAEDNPLPQPENSEMSTNTTLEDGPPNRPDMPIDQNIVYLMSAALFLGFVMIYKNKIKKASV